MGKLYALPSVEKANKNNALREKQKKSSLLNQAFSELKRDTGVDHRKVILGDARERQRLKMKQYQDALKEM
jgi:hypothetical protein